MNRQADALHLLLQILNTTENLLSGESGQGPDKGNKTAMCVRPCAPTVTAGQPVPSLGTAS